MPLLLLLLFLHSFCYKIAMQECSSPDAWYKLITVKKMLTPALFDGRRCCHQPSSTGTASVPMGFACWPDPAGRAVARGRGELLRAKPSLTMLLASIGRGLGLSLAAVVAI